MDFSEYDSDNDGYVDLVYIIYAGYSAQWGDDKAPADAIWPKSGAPTSGNYGTYDGKAIYRYGVNNELAFHPEVCMGRKYLDPSRYSGRYSVRHHRNSNRFRRSLKLFY